MAHLFDIASQFSWQMWAVLAVTGLLAFLSGTRSIYLDSHVWMVYILGIIAFGVATADTEVIPFPGGEKTKLAQIILVSMAVTFTGYHAGRFVARPRGSRHQ